MPECRDEPNAMEIVIAPDAGPPRNYSLAEGGRIRTSVTVTRKARETRCLRPLSHPSHCDLSQRPGSIEQARLISKPPNRRCKSPKDQRGFRWTSAVARTSLCETPRRPARIRRATSLPFCPPNVGNAPGSVAPSRRSAASPPPDRDSRPPEVRRRQSFWSPCQPAQPHSYAACPSKFLPARRMPQALNSRVALMVRSSDGERRGMRAAASKKSEPITPRQRCRDLSVEAWAVADALNDRELKLRSSDVRQAQQASDSAEPRT
jgi:hypothetical protein